MARPRQCPILRIKRLTDLSHYSALPAVTDAVGYPLRMFLPVGQRSGDISAWLLQRSAAHRIYMTNAQRYLVRMRARRHHHVLVVTSDRAILVCDQP